MIIHFKMPMICIDTWANTLTLIARYEPDKIELFKNGRATHAVTFIKYPGNGALLEEHLANNPYVASVYSDRKCTALRDKTEYHVLFKLEKEARIQPILNAIESIAQGCLAISEVELKTASTKQALKDSVLSYFLRFRRYDQALQFATLLTTTIDQVYQVELLCVT